MSGISNHRLFGIYCFKSPLEISWLVILGGIFL